jgi:ABC-type nitrate/sulfonate/bicarbonate transport system substrate-binding protein
MHRRTFVQLGLAVPAVVVLSSPARAQGDLQVIRVAAPATEDSTNMYYAVRANLFKPVGLDVQLFHTTSGSAAVAAVVSGSYDIAASGLMAILNGHLSGIPLVIVAPENMYDSRDPLSLLQIPIDSNAKSGADLNGKTIGVPALNDANTVSVRAWVDKNRGDWRSLQFVEIPNSALVPALQQHRIDAAVIQQPSLSISLAQRTTKTIGDAWAAISPRFLVSVYVARPDWSSQNQNALSRFNRVYVDATKYVNAHLSQTAPFVAEYTGITLSQAQEMRRTKNPTTLGVTLLQPLINAAAKYGAISRGFPASELLPHA